MRRLNMTASGFITVLAVALLLGFTAGRLSGTGIGAEAAASHASATHTPDAAATATRTAELIELDQLRTKVAQTPAAVVCTVAATSTPTSTPTPTLTPTLVPAAAAGAPRPYAGNWSIAVLTVAQLQKFIDVTPEGVFLKVSLSITNNTSAARAFPYTQFVLRDEKGRVFIPSTKAGYKNEAGWLTRFPPNLPTDGFVIFDVATDAMGPFVLESSVDPTFRVQISLEKRG